MFFHCWTSSLCVTACLFLLVSLWSKREYSVWNIWIRTMILLQFQLLFIKDAQPERLTRVSINHPCNHNALEWYLIYPNQTWDIMRTETGPVILKGPSGHASCSTTQLTRPLYIFTPCSQTLEQTQCQETNIPKLMNLSPCMSSSFIYPVHYDWKIYTSFINFKSLNPQVLLL